MMMGQVLVVSILKMSGVRETANLALSGMLLSSEHLKVIQKVDFMLEIVQNVVVRMWFAATISELPVCQTANQEDFII